jgi:hypothetical protein
MAKEIISATVEKVTAINVRELATKEQRSFSKMVDLLLQIGISARNKETANK